MFIAPAVPRTSAWQPQILLCADKGYFGKVTVAGIEPSDDNEAELCRALHDYTARTVPALRIDSYAEKVYRMNRAAGL